MTYRELTEYLTSKFGNSLIAGYSKKSADLEVEKDTLNQLKSIGAITDEEIKSLNKPAHTNCEKTQCFNQVSEQSAKQSQESFDLSNFFESIFGVKIPTTNQTQKEGRTLTVDPLSLLGNILGKDFEKIVQKNGKLYLHGEDDGGWEELITVAKNGFTVEYGTKDTGDDRRFTFDTKLQTMVEIDKDGNIIHPYILKDYCPTGYN